MTGIIPKMAIRFTSYEWYKQLLADKKTGGVSGRATFFGMIRISWDKFLLSNLVGIADALSCSI